MSRHTYFACACFALGTCLVGSQAFGGVAVGTNIELKSPGFAGTNYALTVWQTEAKTDYTDVGFDQNGFSLIGKFYAVDESSEWYVVHSSDSFTAANIASASYSPFILGTKDQLKTIQAIGDFYLGVTTREGYTSPNPTNVVFGWAKFYNNGTTVTLLDSAVAYGYEGIVVGTTQGIPEPASLGLIGIGSLAMLRRRRV